MTALRRPTPGPESHVTVETITPARAHEYIGANTHNRRVRARVVTGYAADMKGGNWRWNGEGIKFDTAGVLLDGQHRLLAIIEADVPVQMLVIRGLDSIAQETMDGGAKRKLSDVLNLRGEADYTQLAASLRAITAWRAGDRRSRSNFTNSQCLATLEDFPWIRDGMRIVARTTARAKMPSSVGGLAWWLFSQIDPEDCEAFFEKLISGEGHRGEPAFMLYKAAVGTTEVRGERNTAYLTAITIKAWNKYRDGETVDLLAWRVGGSRPEPFPEPK